MEMNRWLFDYMRGRTWKKRHLASDCAQPLDEGSPDSGTLSEKDKLLYRAIKADKLKVRLFLRSSREQEEDHTRQSHCQYDQCRNFQINATTAGKKDMEEVINKAKRDAGNVPEEDNPVRG